EDEEPNPGRNEQRDILGELEITARLMITGGEAKEEARLTRADRSLIRECILNAARLATAEQRQVLTHDVRSALQACAADPQWPARRRERAQEMAESMDLFCQGFEGQLFDREGCKGQLSTSYISMMTTVNNVAERDQFRGRPTILVTADGHIITRSRLLALLVVKGTKVWRKLGAWFWPATQNVADFPDAAKA